MKPPTPLKDDDAALDVEERRLLRAGLGMRVPRGAKRAVLLALAAQLPAVASAGTATALTVASVVKYGIVGVVLGAATMTTVAVVRAPAPRPIASATRPSVSAPAQDPQPVRGLRPSLPPADAPAQHAARAIELPLASPTVTQAPVPAAAPPTADTEARRVAAARALTRAGRPQEALGALDAIARDLPHGELVQEREALAIEALLTLGERTAARRRAVAFLQRFPDSPHAAAARRALE
jgi:hypothetical protein